MSQPRRQGDIKTLVKQEKELSSVYLRVAAQSVATLVGSTLVSFETAPYNRIETVLQVENINPQAVRRYENVVTATKRIFNDQGFRTFWRGQTASLLLVIPETVSKHLTHFVLNEVQTFLKSKKKKLYGPKFLYLLLAFVLTNPTALLFTQPLTNAYTKMASDLSPSTQRQYKNVFVCLREIYDNEGVEGCYTGLDTAVLEQVIDFTLSYFLYSYVDRYLAIRDSDSIWLNVAKECVTPVISSVVTYPLKTVRSRLAFFAGNKEKKYTNTIDCVRKIINEEGFWALYKGIDIRMIRNVARVIIFSVAESIIVGVTSSSPVVKL